MDQQQFKKIFNFYYPRLAYYVSGIVSDKNLAENIAMGCFQKLLVLDFNSEKEMKAFLYVRARNAAIFHLRRNKQGAEFSQKDFDMDETAIEREMIEVELKFQLLNEIQSFTPQQKKIALLSLQGLNIAEIADKMCISKNAAIKLRKRVFNLSKIIRFLTNPDEAPKNTLDHVNIIKDEINSELIRHFAKHPHKIHDIDPNKFEKLVAELMKDMGYDVYLTSQTRDGGRDIIAVMNIPSNDQIVTIVECKRHRADRPVDINIVRSFLYTLRDQDKANAGWIVTTSTFSPEAINEQKKYKWQLSLKDNRNLAAWCSNYGQWERPSGSGGLWLPNNPLA